jgi:hypothetical protein
LRQRRRSEQKNYYRKKKFLWQNSSPFLKVTNKSEYSAGSRSAGCPSYQIWGRAGRENGIWRGTRRFGRLILDTFS